MAASSFSGLAGYKSRTIDFKTTKDGPIKLDVVYPEGPGPSATVLLHIHGGFLVVGDRYAFLPHWLINACASRKWVFVTPDYRLLPESTAHAALEDVIDAYQWVMSSLPEVLGLKVDSVLLAGSSAGGYLALTTAAAVERKPRGLLLVYGMLDALYSRYTTPGQNIFNRPVVDTSSTIAKFPHAGKDGSRTQISAYPIPADPSQDSRFPLLGALHINALFLEYMMGVDGMTESVARGGEAEIPQSHRGLFPLAFGDLAGIPRTMLLHGRNDSAVPVELSIRAAEKLGAAGVQVQTEFPDDAEHGFDIRIGDVDVESMGNASITPVTQSLKNVVTFLDSVA